jgi:hypothetical protein
VNKVKYIFLPIASISFLCICLLINNITSVLGQVSPSVNNGNPGAITIGGTGGASTATNPETRIIDNLGVDNNGRHVTNNSLNPPSTSIRFRLLGLPVIPGATIASFTVTCTVNSVEQCTNFANPSTITATNGQATLNLTNRQLGIHTITAAANTNGGVPDPTPVSFSWTVCVDCNIGLGGASTRLQELSDEEKAADKAFQDLKAEQTRQELLRQAEINKNANRLEHAINSPFRECNSTANEAIYTVQGVANVNGLSQQIVSNKPLDLIIYNDQKLNDSANIIVSNNNPFLKGIIVLHLSDGSIRKLSDFNIDRIDTVCRSIPVGKEVIKGKSLTTRDSVGGSTRASLKPVNIAKINPPFETCLTSKGEVPSEGWITDSDQRLNVDVAKYSIQGFINPNSIKKSGNQVIAFVIVHSMNPIGQSMATQPVLLRDSDSNYLLGRLVIDPSLDGNGQVLPFNLQEISTDCIKNPFVSDPTSIGVNDASVFGRLSK